MHPRLGLEVNLVVYVYFQSMPGAMASDTAEQRTSLASMLVLTIALGGLGSHGSKAGKRNCSDENESLALDLSHFLGSIHNC